MKTTGLTIFAGKDAVRNMETEINDSGKTQRVKGKKGSFFAGNANLMNDPVDEKRKEARKKAWNVVESAWKVDRDIDASTDKRRAIYGEMRELEKSSNREIKEIRQEMDSIKEEYGIQDGSKEDAETKLLMKYQDYKNGLSDEPLTEEEQKQAEEIYARGLTEYESRMTELNDRSVNPRKDLKKAESWIKKVNAEITDINIERLKTHKMVDAEKSANEILKAASDEIMGMIVSEGKENVDEKMEEMKEEAEKKAEEKEEKEEKLEEIKEERLIQKAMIEGTKEAVEEAEAAVQRRRNDASPTLDDMIDISVKNSADSNGITESLNEIKNSMKLLEADLKGIKVDETV